MTAFKGRLNAVLMLFVHGKYRGKCMLQIRGEWSGHVPFFHGLNLYDIDVMEK